MKNLGIVGNLKRRIVTTQTRSFRKMCHESFRQAGCGDVMPKVTINKGGFLPSFYTHNGTVDFLDFDIIFSSKKTLRAAAAHDGTHARQHSDLARYHVAKEGGDIEKGLEAFKQNLKEKGFSSEIEDDSFYRAAIKKNLQW